MDGGGSEPPEKNSRHNPDGMIHVSLGGGTGRRTGLKTLHHLLFSSLKTERDIVETLVWSGFQRTRVPNSLHLLQVISGSFWKKKWQKSAKCSTVVFTVNLQRFIITTSITTSRGLLRSCGE